MFSIFVNLNQWFTYGQNWTKIVWAIMQVAQAFAIFAIFFQLPQTLELMFIFVVLVIGGTFFGGFFLFFKGGWQTDQIMALWRNHIMMFMNCSSMKANIEVCKKLEIPVPDYIREYGVKSWDDYDRVLKYIFRKGKFAMVDTMIKDFFGGKNDED